MGFPLMTIHFLNPWRGWWGEIIAGGGVGQGWVSRPGGLKALVMLEITEAYLAACGGLGREKARRVVASGFGGAARDGAAGLWLAGV